jgi:acyl carrier protein
MSALELERELKSLIVSTLNLEDIAPDDIASEEPLFDAGLGLDSIDALELGVAIQKRYGIKISAPKQELRESFATVRNLARFIERQRSGA